MSIEITSRRSVLLLATAVLAGAAIACGAKDTARPAAEAPKVTNSAAAVPQVAPAKPGYAVADRVVSTEWLAGKTSDSSVVSFDLRKKEAYDAGHVPGAVWISTADFNVAKAGVTDLAPAAQIEAALSKAGVKPDTTIVLYDDQGSLWSTRILWSLEVYGHKDARVLNGSWTTWQTEKKPVTKDIMARPATQYAFAAKPNDKIIVTMEQMTKAVGDPSKIVCDSRTADEYTGRDLRAKIGGHVPGAKNVNYSDAVDKGGAFLPVEELKQIYDTAGVRASDNQTIFTYCQSGIRAAHAWFVLKYLVGYQNVAVYDGSWEEWGNRTDTKTETSRG